MPAGSRLAALVIGLEARGRLLSALPATPARSAGAVRHTPSVTDLNLGCAEVAIEERPDASTRSFPAARVTR